MSLSYKDDLSVQNWALEKKFEENDQVLMSLMSVLKKTAFRDRVLSLIVKTIYVLTIPLFLWALSVDATKLDNMKNSPLDLALLITGIFCVSFVSIHSRVTDSATNYYDDSNSVGEYAKKILRKLMLKNVKVAFKKSKSVFKKQDEKLNVMMSMVYIFSQNSLIRKTDEEVEAGFNSFKNLDSSLSSEGVLSLYLEQCVTDFLNVYFVLNPEEETISLKKIHKMYERKRNAIMVYEEKVKSREAKDLSKRELKEKKRQLNGLEKSVLDIEISNNNENVLAGGYVERKF